VLARALDSWWAQLAYPDPFVVVEAGAGAGTLARDVLGAAPACAPALRYVLVERSDALRARHRDQVPLEPPSAALGMVSTSAGDDEVDGLAGAGPVVTSLPDLPSQPVVGAVIANELLDNLPTLLLERGDDRWLEVRVGERHGELAEVLVPAAPRLAGEADRLAPRAPPGGRVPLQHAAASWLRQALAGLLRGRVVVFDFADTTPSLARRPWREWLRTYRSHARGGHPLEEPGSQDVTCEVAVDQLALIRRPSSNRSQGEFLRAHGLDERVAVARATWEERAGLGDIDAMRARSTVSEAVALTDPAGLGAFRALEWEVW
jgi:SAM-dependent MidA family methyltransferase